MRGGRSWRPPSIACCSAVLRSGSASARNPCLVRNQNDFRAPAARKRALSVPVSACVSQLIAQTCSSGAQSQTSPFRSEEHTSELQSLTNLVCRLLLEKKKNKNH